MRRPVTLRFEGDYPLRERAAEIRLRAERRLGELIAAQKESVGLNRGLAGSVVTGSDREPVKDARPTLADVGIDKKLAARAQKLAAVPEEKFEGMLGELIAAQKESVGLNRGTRGQLNGRDTSGGTRAEPPEDARPKLAAVGIDKKLSARAQKLAIPRNTIWNMPPQDCCWRYRGDRRREVPHEH